MSLSFSPSSLDQLGSMPLDKVCELVCAHAKLQAEHSRLNKKVKQLQVELEDITFKRQKELVARIDNLSLSTERHIQALSLNCDELIRRKHREVDELLLQMRRDMLERVSAAIASSPPPEVKRMRSVAAQPIAAGGSNRAEKAAAAVKDQMASPMSRRLHALSELVAMSNDTSFGESSNHNDGSHSADAGNSAAQTPPAAAPASSAAARRHHQQAHFSIPGDASSGSVLLPAAPQQYASQNSSLLHSAPRIYQPATAAAASISGGAGNAAPSQTMMMIHNNSNSSVASPQPVVAQIRYDVTPGLNTSSYAARSMMTGTSPGFAADGEGDLHTFLW